MSLYRRYRIKGIAECPDCGEISMFLEPIGGAPGDPGPSRHSVPEPRRVPKVITSPEEAGEVLAETLINVFAGSAVKQDRAGSGLTLEFSMEEYEKLLPLAIGDVLEFEVSKLEK